MAKEIHIDETEFGRKAKTGDITRDFSSLPKNDEKDNSNKTNNNNDEKKEKIEDGKQLSFFIPKDYFLKFEFYCKISSKMKKQVLREQIMKFIDSLDNDELNKGMASIYAKGLKP